MSKEMITAYIRTDENGDLADPRESTNNEQTARKAWGKDSYTKQTINKNQSTKNLAKKMVDGKVVTDAALEQVDKDIDNKFAEMETRILWFKMIKDKIDFSKKFDIWHIAEKKVYGNIEPTDTEFKDYDASFKLD